VRFRENVRLKKERLQFVTSKLRSLGWGAELKYIEQDSMIWGFKLKYHPMMNVPKPMTERSWRTIQDEILECMQDIREDRQAREWESRMHRRWRAFIVAGNKLLDQQLAEHPELWAYGLDIDDFALTPEIREIMNRPAEELVHQHSFMALQAQAGAILEGWRSRICNQLRDLMRSSMRFPQNVDPLELATTTFCCENCVRTCLFFPNVVAHRCQRSRSSAAQQDAYSHLVHEAMNPFSMRLREYELSESACQIVQFCGKDPETTTAKEMDALDIRLATQGCAIMTWRAAIIEQTQFNHDMSVWRIADSTDMANAKEREAKLVQDTASWLCHKCIPPCFDNNPEKHLEHHHGVGKPSADKDDMMPVFFSEDICATSAYKLRLPDFEVVELMRRDQCTSTD